MGIRKTAAEAISVVSTAVLRNVFHRPAENFPGKVALYVDPAIIADQRQKMARGSVCVVGTNGKTTVTNMLANCLVSAGQRVVCNRGGANLDSGVATCLLHAKRSDWGVFECDELWLVKILPHLQSEYVVLLNLFPDQLDRTGGLDYIQDSIARALKASPRTTLIYNADDPHCEKIARMVNNPRIPFGINEALDTLKGAATDAQICQECDTMLDYAYRTYSQLGSFSCPQCGFSHAHSKFMARGCTVGLEGMEFDIVAATDEEAIAGGAIAHLAAPYTGTYMIYNLLAVYVAGHIMGLSNNVIQLSVNSFDEHNGRLEHLDVQGRSVLLNLAKNPTGFNQNLGIVLQEEGPVAVGFFVNDMEGDGRDVSWIWDVDFESLAGRKDTFVFVGGMRAHDLQVRLKYAGVPSIRVENATELMGQVSGLDSAYKVFMIANYTSLPEVRAECVELIEKGQEAPDQVSSQPPVPKALPEEHTVADKPGLHIVHLYPDLLDQGGDAGNVTILEKRCRWRGIPVTVEQLVCGQAPLFTNADIVVLVDGFDRQQRLACSNLLPVADACKQYIESGGVMLAIDGGLQILGSSWYIDDEELSGLGVLDMKNGRAKGKSTRIVGDIVVQTELVSSLVVGFENHEGVTELGVDMQPFGNALKGIGNNTGDSTEGILYKNLIGSYVHGPILAKSPELADYLIARALERKGAAPTLAPLDDTEEQAANAFMRSRLGL